MKPNIDNTFSTALAGPDREGRGTVPVRLALALLKAYKLALSPLFAGSCRFLPTCADYAREAVILHGVLAGSYLAARRLVRCHPLCACGHDPVPLPDRR